MKAYVARGIRYSDTPYPGQYELTYFQNSRVPEHLREPDGVYDDIGGWAKLCIARPELFTRDEQTRAWDTLRAQFPDVYREEVEQLIREFGRKGESNEMP